MRNFQVYKTYMKLLSLFKTIVIELLRHIVILLCHPYEKQMKLYNLEIHIDNRSKLQLQRMNALDPLFRDIFHS